MQWFGIEHRAKDTPSPGLLAQAGSRLALASVTVSALALGTTSFAANFFFLDKLSLVDN
jgi:hypothetical protein